MDGTVKRDEFSIETDVCSWDLDSNAAFTPDGVLESHGAPGQCLAYSAELTLQAGHEYGLRLDFLNQTKGVMTFGITDAETGNWLKSYNAYGRGPKSAFVCFSPDKDIVVKGVVADSRTSSREPLRLGAPNVCLFERIDATNEAPDLAHNAGWDLVDGVPPEGSHIVLGEAAPLQQLLQTPAFDLVSDIFYAFVLIIETTEFAEVSFGLEDITTNEFITSRTVKGIGQIVLHLPYLNDKLRRVRLHIGGGQTYGGGTCRIHLVSLEEKKYPTVKTVRPTEKTETFLPHWGPIRQNIHRLCRSSKTWNSFVAAVEMRLGRQELISVPQYMAICPTGQCNALCEFCSVTINRTGIIKRQLPLENLEKFLSPVTNTIRMYGLEGNGEPTLFRGFDDLMRRLLSNDGKIYLITNGSRLNRQTISLLMHQNVDSVNFSLNAATPETHRRVMKLKQFSPVVDAIKELTHGRGSWLNPIVSVSFVVEKKNIHEVQEFLHFAEEELKVDRIYVRPLSELGAELGTVEDHRDLQPYESDIRDMLDSVNEYLCDTERASDIFITPENFRAVRPDPIENVLMPFGMDKRLLAPRRAQWTQSPYLHAVWHINQVRLKAEEGSEAGVIFYSALVPVESNSTLEFKASAWTIDKPIEIMITDPMGKKISSYKVEPGSAENFTDLNLRVETTCHSSLRIAICYLGNKLDACIDFQRLRTPAPRPSQKPKLPYPERWEINAADAVVKWTDNRLRIERVGFPSSYILKSYAVTCLPNLNVSFEIKIILDKGSLGLGILNEDGSDFIKRFRFDESGVSDVVLAFNTGRNRSFRIAAYTLEEPNSTEVKVAATVDWNSAIAMRPDFHNLQTETTVASKTRPNEPSAKVLTRAVQPDHIVKAKALEARDSATVEKATANDEPAIEAVSLAMPDRPNLAYILQRKINILQRKINSAAWLYKNPDQIKHVAYSRLIWLTGLLRKPSNLIPNKLKDLIPNKLKEIIHRVAYGKPKFFCQKPWTDLANFTVDGRMDVCCIATGASQERYALGNLNEQSFQEVWNGERIKEFRRTINGANKLPPCQRCPMAYAYQGPFFNPNYTVHYIRDTLLGTMLLRRLRGWRGAGILQYLTFYPLLYILYIPMYLFTKFVWFRNFKR